MTAIRAFTADNNGNRWDFSYEWSNDQQTDPWVLAEWQVPRDLGEIDRTESDVLEQLAMAIGRGTGTHD